MDFLSATAIFFSGLVIGFLVSRKLSPDKARLIAVTEELEAVKNEFTEYKDQVDMHFQESDQLMSEFTNVYSAVQDHFAQGIQKLSPVAYSNRLEYGNNQQAKLSHQSKAYYPHPEQRQQQVQNTPDPNQHTTQPISAQTNPRPQAENTQPKKSPPKDYATGENNSGMLSESYSVNSAPSENTQTLPNPTDNNG